MIPGPLTHTMINIAQKSFELWRRDEKTAMHYAAGVLAGPTNLRATTGQLPEPVASARWRLIRLLEYFRSILPTKAISKLPIRLTNIYYSPRSYWKGLTSIKKLASAAMLTEQPAKG